jgi:TRAP-type C4-dicarboxylate transport system substrate-binding protein
MIRTLLALFAALALGAQTTTLKLATLVPANSSWFRILKAMGDAWERDSGGRVKVVFFPGGRQGDEPDVVRKMRLGTLQGAVLASPGLAEIDRAVYALSIPLAFDNADEVYGVLERLRPGLEKTMESKGFVALNWADGGWIHIFSRRPVATPEELKRQKLFQWAGDTRTLEIWKAAGFNAIPAPATELATGLQTGLVDAFLTSPQVALLTRHYEQARNMTDLKWSLIMAATVVSREVWDRIPPDLRPVILKDAREAGLKLRQDMRESEARDLDALRKAGLAVVPVDAAKAQAWRQAFDAVRERIRGDFVPAGAYDEALKWRDEARRRPGR